MFMAFTGATYFPDLGSLIGIAACGSGSSHYLLLLLRQRTLAVPLTIALQAALLRHL